MSEARSGQVRVGVDYGWSECRIDPDAVAAFARATDDPNPRCRSGEVVPALFTAAVILPSHDEAFFEGIDPDAFVGFRSSVHAEHDVTFHRPLRPGDAIRVRSRVHSVAPTPAGALVAIGVEVTDTSSNLLVEHLWSSIFVGCHTGHAAGPPLPDHRLDLATAVSIGQRDIAVAPDQGFRYAGASGDRPGHSIDDEHARSEGFARKILQGMCSFALASGAVLAEVAGGDPSRVRRLAVRFSAPTHPGTRMSIALYDCGDSTTGNRVVGFDATSQDSTVLRHGLAEIVPS